MFAPLFFRIFLTVLITFIEKVQQHKTNISVGTPNRYNVPVEMYLILLLLFIIILLQPRTD